MRIFGFLQRFGFSPATRKAASGDRGFSEEDAKEPAKVASELVSIKKRLASVESSLPADSCEFVVDVLTVGQSFNLNHGFSSMVRWWVTDWMKASDGTTPTAAPVFVKSTSTISGTLNLVAQVKGTAIVRVEAVY